jgi:hypothetical protein
MMIASMENVVKRYIETKPLLCYTGIWNRNIQILLYDRQRHVYTWGKLQAPGPLPEGGK